MSATARKLPSRLSPTETCLSLRLIIVGLAGAGFFQLCGCHQTVMVFGPSAIPAAPALTGEPAEVEAAKVNAARNELPGIPFYTHYGVCTRETVWLEPQTTLSLTVTPDGGKPTTRTMILNNQAFRDQNPQGHDANSLVAALEQVEGKHDHEITSLNKKLCPANVAEGWDAVRDAYKVTPVNETSAADIAAKEEKTILVRVSNTASIGTAVDYSRVYYLNARSPLIGTGTVDAKLNADGTLGEGSASVDDETLGDLLTAAATVGSGGLTAWSTVAAAKISGSATVLAAAGGSSKAPNFVPPISPVACEAADGWPEVKESVAYDVKVTNGGFKHDHKKVTPLETEPHRECSVADAVVGGSYTVTPVGEESKPYKDAIQVSGSIALPKPKDDKANKP